MSSPVSPKNNVDLNQSQTFEFLNTSKKESKELKSIAEEKEKQPQNSKNFSLNLSEIFSNKDDDPNKITKIAFIILGIAFLGGCFIAYKRWNPPTVPVQPLPPPKEYRLTGKIKTKISPKS